MSPAGLLYILLVTKGVLAQSTVSNSGYGYPHTRVVENEALVRSVAVV